MARFVWWASMAMGGCAGGVTPSIPDDDPGLTDCDGWCVDLGCPTDGARCEMGACVCFGCAAFDDYVSGEGVLGAECTIR